MADRAEAQRRANQIHAFRAELDALATDGVSPLTAQQDASVRAYHDQLLTRLAAAYDIDPTAAAGRLSRGMQLASLFAAVALTAAMYSLVSRFWGRLDLPLQASLLCGFPLMALVGVELSARRERTFYVASLFALVAYGTFWLTVSVLSELLNMPVTPHSIWAGALFGLALAIAYGFRLILALALASLIVAISGTVFAAAGHPWTAVFDYLDLLTLTALATTPLASHLARIERTFGMVTRLVALGIGLGGLLALSTSGGMSVLPISRDGSELFYQGVMLIACVVALFAGIRRQWPETVNVAAVALTAFLAVRFVDWFWSTLPRYMFFLVLAAVAFAWLLVLRRVRDKLVRS